MRTRVLRPLIRCVVLDLDDTLYDCFGQRVRPTHRYAARAMVRAGLRGSVEAVYRARMQAFRHDPRLRHIDAAVMERFGAVGNEAISRAAHDAYFNCPVGKLKLFRSSRPILRHLKAVGCRVFVVTYGEPKTQLAKVKALGLDREPSIDRIFYADRRKQVTKDSALREILKITGLPAAQCLVIGDRPSSEIRAGKALGMHTVRIRRGEYEAQQPVGREESPDVEIRVISAVRKLPFTFGKA
jgi:putative hydrolase of the HAD superfamily